MPGDLITYQSFPIFFTGTEEAAFVMVRGAPAGSSEQERLDPAKLSAANEKLRGDLGNREHVKAAGKALFDLLFTDRLRGLYDKSCARVDAAGKGLRLLLHIEVERLRDWPWELLYSSRDDDFLALQAGRSIARYLPREEPAEVSERRGPLRVLAVFASPQGQPELDLQSELEWITSGVAQANTNSAARAEGAQIAIDVLIHDAYTVRNGANRRGNATLDDLIARVASESYDVLHFAGHGAFDAGKGMLVLEEADRTQRQLSAHDLKLLAEGKRLRLAVVAACHSADTVQSARQPTGGPMSRSALARPVAEAEHVRLGVGQALVRAGVGAVVAMRAELPDNAAIRFSKAFYSALSRNQPVDACLTEARQEIWLLQEKENTGTDFHIPVLFMENPEDWQHVATAAAPLTAREGLGALKELMRTPAVLDAVARSSGIIEAVREQVQKLSYCKALHDQLHRLQRHCYNRLVAIVPRFPWDERDEEDLGACERMLQELVMHMERIAGASPPGENDNEWIETLADCSKQLHGVARGSDARRLRTTVRRIESVINNQMTGLNGRLHAVARTLRLSELADAMRSIQQSMAGQDLDAAQMRRFEEALVGLDILKVQLPAQVEQHDSWQELDNTLRPIASGLDLDLSYLEDFWHDVDRLGGRTYRGQNGDWAEDLTEAEKALETAMSRQDLVETRKQFREYRRLVQSQFYTVDFELNGLCSQLVQIDPPLRDMMEMLK